MKLRAKQETRLRYIDRNDFVSSVWDGERLELDMDDFEVIDEPEKLQEIEELDVTGESILKEQEWKVDGFCVKDASLDVVEDKINELVKTVNQLIKEREQ